MSGIDTAGVVERTEVTTGLVERTEVTGVRGVTRVSNIPNITSERSSGEMLTLSIALGSFGLNLHWFSSCRLPNLNSHLIISSRICNDM